MFSQSHFPFWKFMYLPSATKPSRDYALWRTAMGRIFHHDIWKLHLLWHLYPSKNLTQASWNQNQRGQIKGGFPVGLFPRDSGDVRWQSGDGEGNRWNQTGDQPSAGPARWLSTSRLSGEPLGTRMAALVPALCPHLQGHLHGPSRTFPSRQLRLAIAHRTVCDLRTGSSLVVSTSPERAHHQAQEGSRGEGPRF